MLIRWTVRKIGEKCNDVKVQSLCRKCAELPTCIFYSFKMALKFPWNDAFGHALVITCNYQT